MTKIIDAAERCPIDGLDDIEIAALAGRLIGDYVPMTDTAASVFVGQLSQGDRDAIYAAITAANLLDERLHAPDSSTAP